MEWLSRWFGQKVLPPSQIASVETQPLSSHWENSPIHLAVLQRFLSGRDATNGVPDFWTQALGMPPQRVIDRMVSFGMLEPVSLLETVEYCHTGAELKKLLSARGLKVSGRKAEQAQRLIENDLHGMEELCKHRKFLKCSSSMRSVVEAWLAKQAVAFDKATDEVISALRARQFKMAIRIADVYNERKFELPVHPAQEAMTIKVPQQSVEERMADLAKVFTMHPKILNGLRPEEWEGLHLDYLVWQLLGRSAPEKCMPGFTGVGAMGAGTVLLMLSFYIRHQQDMVRRRELSLKKATVSCCNSGSCDACMALDGKTYRLDKLPELPHKECTCDLGCRCYASPEINI